MPLILDGKATAAIMRQELSAAAAEFAEKHGRRPALAVVEIAGDPAAARYVRAIQKACQNTGFTFNHRPLTERSTQAEIEDAVRELSSVEDVDGIIIQMPLPPGFDSRRVVEALDPRKDVDGLHPLNLGRLAQGLPALVPGTPAGGMELLRRFEIPIRGRHAVVVGRSNVVGKPLALLLLNEHATVTICHSRTPDLADEIRRADLVAVAVGKAALVTGSMLKPGAVVLDFGINVDEHGTVTGDVDYASAAAVAAAITPVPGGTGPMTNIMLLRNTLDAARAGVRRGS